MASVLFLGASGQVGGAFLTVFRQKYPNIPLTAYLRSTTLDTALTNLGNITVVHGTFDEHDKLTSLASTHSIIIDSAASFQPAVSAALLHGIKNNTTLPPGRKPILLHLSGTGNFTDHSHTGDYIPNHHHFNDANPSQVRLIDASYPPNGETDRLVFDAAAAGDVNAFFVGPCGIYGASANHLGRSTGDPSALARGVWVKWNTDNITQLGFSPYVGSGSSEWRTVHVDDVVSLMMLVFERALRTWDEYRPEDVYGHYYIAANEERVSNKGVADAFAELMYRREGTKEQAGRSVKFEEAGITANYLGSNMLFENDNAKSLGWKAEGPGFLETLKQMN